MKHSRTNSKFRLEGTSELNARYLNFLACRRGSGHFFQNLDAKIFLSFSNKISQTMPFSEKN
jgi:hypothetical protein